MSEPAITAPVAIAPTFAGSLWSPREKWDRRWSELAQTVADWSEDRSRKIGCVVVNTNQAVVSLGWNGFPRRVSGNVEARHERPAKYLWTEHAERNAIFNAAAIGVSTAGCRLYTTLYPCADCARAVIQSGIFEVVCPEPAWDDPAFAASFAVTREMLREAGVCVTFIAGISPAQQQLGAAAPAKIDNAAANMNIGHGHVFPRPDGVKMRCGGRAMCRECQNDADLARRGVGQRPA